MDLLTREQILNADDIKTEDVEVAEWGGSVRVRGMTGAEKDSFEQGVVSTKKKNHEVSNFRSRYIAPLIVDENGKRLFADSDIEELGKKNGKALNLLFDVARKLSGENDDDVEDMAGNS